MFGIRFRMMRTKRNLILHTAMIRKPALRSPLQLCSRNAKLTKSLRTSSTTSVTASILEYRELHGRTFQNFHTTEYWCVLHGLSDRLRLLMRAFKGPE